MIEEFENIIAVIAISAATFRVHFGSHYCLKCVNIKETFEKFEEVVTERMIWKAAESCWNSTGKTAPPSDVDRCVSDIPAESRADTKDHLSIFSTDAP